MVAMIAQVFTRLQDVRERNAAKTPFADTLETYPAMTHLSAPAERTDPAPNIRRAFGLMNKY